MVVTGKTLSALSYALVIGLVGLPMWWFTTEIVRYPLPFHKIEELSNDAVQQLVSVEVISNDGNILKDFDSLVEDSKIFKFQKRFRALTPTEEKLMVEFEDVQRFDEALSGFPNEMESVILFDTNKVGKTIAIGKRNTIYFSSSMHPTHVMVSVVREIVLGEKLIEHMISAIQSPNETGKSKKWLLRKTLPSPEYDLLLTMLVPEPEITNVKWNVELAVENYLRPFLDEFGDSAEFQVKSQKLYLTSLGLKSVRPLKDKDGNVIGKSIKQEDLGLAINMESKLVSHVSSRKAFNFLAYIPTERQSPLFVEEDDGTPLETNAFLVPRWGGVSIWNVNSTAQNFDDRYFMSVVITQLRLLLGLGDKPVALKGVEIVNLGDAPLRDWEKNFMCRMKIFEYLVTSKVTLQSLSDLLSKIVNIVITEEVAKDVIVAVDAYEESSECMKSGKVRECFKSAKLSFTASEHVFFDNSLLALLYFPEDQKYAIYVPLFLPVFMSLYGCVAPAIQELMKLFRSWRGRVKPKTE